MSTAINDFAVYLHTAKQHVDQQLNLLLPLADSQSQLNTALRYSVLNNGKRMRPAVVYAVGEALEIPLESLHGIAMSIELIHCYSLIHDDLPAMDDDDLRRGVPTCHKAFDEATAILAGDGLQALAFEVLTNPKWTPFKAETQIKLVRILAHAAGVYGMVLGQAYDLAAETKTLSLEELTRMHALKTGALFNACVEMTIHASPTALSSTLQQQLLSYAQHLGLAFQIQDDILDVIGDTQVIGKPAGSDQKQNKATFTSILGLEGSQQHLNYHMQQALAAVEPLGTRSEILSDLAEFLVSRTY